MAMNPCKECSTPISSDAKTCPSCGAKQKKKKAFKRTIAGVLAAATLYAGVKIGQKMEDNSKINKATQTLVDLSEDTLTEYGLGTKENGKFEIGNNSVSDYSVLDANTPMEVYIYKLAINDNEEFNKFILLMIQ